MARALDQARSRAENRVELFLDAARELMSTNSGEFTVQEVVERSGQSLRTFYQYFAGKHELLLALFEESIRSAAAHLEQVIEEHDAPLDRLRRFTLEYFRMCSPTPKDGAITTPAPAMVEFAQQLLTSHPREAAEAFAPLVVMLEALLAAASSGARSAPDSTTGGSPAWSCRPSCSTRSRRPSAGRRHSRWGTRGRRRCGICCSAASARARDPGAHSWDWSVNVWCSRPKSSRSWRFRTWSLSAARPCRTSAASAASTTSPTRGARSKPV